MENKHDVKFSEILRKNVFKILITLFLICALASFVYSLGFMVKHFVDTQDSGWRYTVYGQGANETIYDQYIDFDTKTSNYYDFYMPTQSVNRFLLVSAVISIILIGICKFTGSTRRRKFYISNFVTCGLVGVVGIVFALISITKITSVKDNYYNYVLNGVVEPSKEKLLNGETVPDLELFSGSAGPFYVCIDGTLSLNASKNGTKWYTPEGKEVATYNFMGLKPLRVKIEYTSVLNTYYNTTKPEEAKEKAEVIAKIQAGDYDYVHEIGPVITVGYVINGCTIAVSFAILCATGIKFISQLKKKSEVESNE